MTLTSGRSTRPTSPLSNSPPAAADLSPFGEFRKKKAEIRKGLATPKPLHRSLIGAARASLISLVVFLNLSPGWRRTCKNGVVAHLGRTAHLSRTGVLQLSS